MAGFDVEIVEDDGRTVPLGEIGITALRVAAGLPPERPAAAESTVIAKPDPLRGEIVAPYVNLARVPRASDALARGMQEHRRRVTVPCRHPREIFFVERLRRTRSVKVRRVELRSRQRD